jgi:riboflavin kinase/FMN adenylyltransferase
MKVYHSLGEIPRIENTAITIGTFDGMHRGHRLIIDALTARARELGGRSLVITFHPHPQEVLRKTGEAVPLLTTIDERIAEFEKLGVDAVLVLPFTTEFAALPWQEFCDLLLKHCGIAHIIFGHDHAFGRNREGNAASLRSYGAGHGFGVTEIGPLVLEGEAISSTKIRRALASGDIEKASHYLGRPYGIIGTVVRGDGRGRTLGIPTANIRPTDPAKLIPSNGVYCVTLTVDGESFSGMANIGVRPTFTEGIERTIEANLFDFDRAIYERTVLLEFRKFVRSERKFSSGEEFLAQLEKDRAVCRGEKREDN